MDYSIDSANKCREDVDYDPVPNDFKIIGIIYHGVIIYDFFTGFDTRFYGDPTDYGFEQMGDTWYWASVDGLTGVETRLNGEQVKVVLKQRSTLDAEWVTVSKYQMTRGFFDFEETK